MSGGYFNYAFVKLDFRIFETRDDLNNMVNHLRVIDKHDIADELEAFVQKIDSALSQLTKDGERLMPLIHAIEWQASGDWNIDSVDKAWDAIKSPEKA